MHIAQTTEYNNFLDPRVTNRRKIKLYSSPSKKYATPKQKSVVSLFQLTHNTVLGITITTILYFLNWCTRGIQQYISSENLSVDDMR